MNQVFDRETPRSRKVNNEKARTDRNGNGSSNSRRYHPQQESSVATEGTASTEQESPPSTINKEGGSNDNNPFVIKSAGAPPPPIPRVISNCDSSMLSYSAVPHSVANAAIAYRDTNAWTGDADYWNALSHIPSPHHTPSYSIGGSVGSFVNGNDYHGMYWHPGKGTSIPYAGGLQQQQQHHHQQYHQQHPYWHHMSTIPYVGVPHPPHPHHHSPDMHQHYMMFSEPRIDHLQPFNHHHHHHHAPPDISADTGAFTSSYPYIVGNNNTTKNMTGKILPASATCITMSDSSLTSCTVEGPDMADETSSPPSLLNTCTVDGPDMTGEELPVMPTPSEILATVTEA
ncbi:MAG: hypothetical protein ACI8RD_007914 [Bacillariaceae sp.]|jgi:hypothetical protein